MHCFHSTLPFVRTVSHFPTMSGSQSKMDVCCAANHGNRLCRSPVSVLNHLPTLCIPALRRITGTPPHSTPGDVSPACSTPQAPHTPHPSPINRRPAPRVRTGASAAASPERTPPPSPGPPRRCSHDAALITQQLRGVRPDGGYRQRGLFEVVRRSAGQGSGKS